MVHRKEQDMVLGTTGVSFENMLSERSQTWKNTECVSPLTWSVQNGQIYRER